MYIYTHVWQILHWFIKNWWCCEYQTVIHYSVTISTLISVATHFLTKLRPQGHPGWWHRRHNALSKGEGTKTRVSNDWSWDFFLQSSSTIYTKTWESLVLRITLQCQSSSLQKNCIHSTSNLLTTKRNKKHVWLPGLEGEGGAYHESGDVSQLGNSQKLRRNGCGETTKFGRASNFEIHPYLL